MRTDISCCLSNGLLEWCILELSLKKNRSYNILHRTTQVDVWKFRCGTHINFKLLKSHVVEGEMEMQQSLAYPYAFY